jgi:DNA invertase Pin-like site-specific DNA recombinase
MDEPARERLRTLRRRRRKLDGEQEKLTEDTKREIRAIVGRGRVSPTEAAELTGLHRSTVYAHLETSD